MRHVTISKEVGDVFQSGLRGKTVFDDQLIMVTETHFITRKDFSVSTGYGRSVEFQTGDVVEVNPTQLLDLLVFGEVRR